MLAPGQGVRRSVIGMSYGPKDQVHLIHQIGPAKGQMQACTSIEDDESTLWVCSARILRRHPRNLRMDSDG
jgi:hypothetical protein